MELTKIWDHSTYFVDINQIPTFVTRVHHISICLVMATPSWLMVIHDSNSFEI